ncbi:MAG: 30S ribosomal protein S13 [Desulfurococcales archaeon]|nr:30S ribosomal protein S13 [Desulfurococcales archaeon]
MASEEQFRYIVRIAGTDINGKLKLAYGLAEIKGIGYTTALAIARMLGLNPEKRVGFLTDEEIKRIEEAVKDLRSLGLPPWLYNRRKDYETGEDKHLIGAELLFHARRDIEREIRIGSWRGVRHRVGLKVRGQRTHTTGRLGMTVGVKKKKK